MGHTACAAYDCCSTPPSRIGGSSTIMCTVLALRCRYWQTGYSGQCPVATAFLSWAGAARGAGAGAAAVLPVAGRASAVDFGSLVAGFSTSHGPLQATSSSEDSFRQ
eukprot:1034191-Amphidinium_carterae.2